MRDWAGYLALAERLSHEQEEASLRSAVSRAYYSAYNTARQQVCAKEPMFSFRDDDHWKVWEWYSKQPGRGAQVQTIGQALRSLRNRADYDRLSNYKAEAESAVRKAKQLLMLLASFA